MVSFHIFFLIGYTIKIFFFYSTHLQDWDYRSEMRCRSWKLEVRARVAFQSQNPYQLVYFGCHCVVGCAHSLWKFRAVEGERRHVLESARNDLGEVMWSHQT